MKKVDVTFSVFGCDKKIASQLLDPLPVDRPGNWTALVNQPLSSPEHQQIQTSLGRDCPLGTLAWANVIAKKLGISYTLNPRGRPKKKEKT